MKILSYRITIEPTAQLPEHAPALVHDNKGTVAQPNIPSQMRPALKMWPLLCYVGRVGIFVSQAQRLVAAQAG